MADFLYGECLTLFWETSDEEVITIIKNQSNIKNEKLIRFKKQNTEDDKNDDIHHMSTNADETSKSNLKC